MFDKLNQTIDSRLQHISSEINQLQTRLDAYDSTRLALQIDQQSLIDSFENILADIRQTLDNSISEFRSELKEQ